jgi:flagellar hook-associated protein 2
MSSAISSSTSPSPTSSSTSGAAAGSSLITSTGIGSGLNIGAIVSALTTAEGAGQQNLITRQQTSLNAQLSAFGTFSSALSTLQATVSTLESPSSLAGFTATVADNTIASATTNSQAVAGKDLFAAKNFTTEEILSSAPVATADTVIGTGTLEISVGGQSTSITIGTTNDTLAGIAETINAASNNPGVSASVLSTTAGARLVISGTETGAANAITVAETDGGTGLSSLTYNPANTTNSLTQTQAALDANFTVNGYAATSASNVVSSAISGVTLTLIAPTAPAVGSTPAATTTLTIAPDATAAQTSIGTFVTAVNGVLSAIQTLGGYNATTQTAGPLNGNATLEAFQTQLQNVLDTVTSNSSGGASSLADLGIAADANTGQYDSNTTTLHTALTANLTAVGNLLGGTNGIATQLNNLLTSYTGPGGLLSTITQGLQTSLSNVSQQQTELNAQLAAYSATLTAQYNAMDTAVALLKQTQTYLNAEFNPSANLSSSGQSSSSSLSAGTTST